jgi:hypothetical protein
VDPSRFDDLARVLSNTGARRTLLRALFGTMLGSAAIDETMARKRAKGKNRGNDRDERRDRHDDRDDSQDRERQADQRLQAERRGKTGKRRKKKRGRGNGSGPSEPPPAACCGTKSCPDPEPGSTRSECDYAGQSFAGQDHDGSTFRGIDGRGATFNQTDNHGSVFAEACLQGARFRRARLDGSTWGDACLFGADFAGADLGDDLTLFDNALFCNTVMPDGSVNDRDCGRATACCRREAEPGPACQAAADCADQPCRTKTCQNGTCAYDEVFTGPSPNALCTFCCDGDCCLSPANQCNTQNSCCAPNCEGRVCGPDGCGGGGTCGPCSVQAGRRCTAAGQCVCDSRSCPDGCCDANKDCWPGDTVQRCGQDGASCQTCGAGQGCINQRCVACTPQCAGRQCGPDGCGGQCGECDGLLCDDETGQCLCTASVCPGCCSNGPGNPGVCRFNQANTCGTNGQQCVNCLPPGSCNAQGQCVCTPDCGGKECGSDGCGGQCGSCRPGEICDDPIPGRCACLADSCPTGLQCCPADGTDRCLRPNGEVCGQSGDCCSSTCCGGTCCEQRCCGESCCDPGQFCCDGVCCDQPCCGGVCCGRGQPCCSGVCCCGTGEFGQNCCGDNGDTCCFTCEGPCSVCCGNDCRTANTCQCGDDEECCSGNCASDGFCRPAGE